MIHWNLIRRQLMTARQQSVVFVLCVSLALVTLVGLNNLGLRINQTLLGDARTLQAADITISGPQPLSFSLTSVLENLQQRGAVEQMLVRQFFTVARDDADTNSLLVELKVVETGYPFYGQVELASGRPLSRVLTSGRVVVEQLVLDRLAVQIGAAVKLGDATLEISDVIENDPVRPVNFFAFGPRIMVSADDLAALNLVRPGSRVRYRTLLRVNDPSQVAPIADQLRRAADPEMESVRTYRTSRTGVQRFFDDLLFFLSLVAIFILILAGIGIQTSLTALLRERDNTVAVLKTLGATNRFVTVHFLIVIAILATLGTLLGITGGIALQRVFTILLADFLPRGVSLELSWRIVAESLLLSFVVVAAFTYLPLDRLEELRPSFILRKATIPIPRRVGFYATLFVLIAFAVGMILWQLGDLERSLYFLGGTFAVVGVAAGFSELAVRLFRRLKIRRLDLRQAQRGLFRPRNATRATVITLASALAVVFTIYLLEQNLDAAFVRSYPPDAPNVIFVDIQPDQRETFREFVTTAAAGQLRRPPTFYPVIRGNIVSINSVPLDRKAQRQRRGDNLARQFNLTYREQLLRNEAMLIGETLFDPDCPDPQVSILDEVLKLHPFQIGDTITFRIQGVPLTATVTSIRTRPEKSLAPFFYFVFPQALLESAPHSIFTAVHVPPDKIGTLQNRIVARFPNVSVIDITKAVAAVAEVARKLSLVIRVLAAFSIAAGLLIIVSSVYATRIARTREAVYYKVLGARRSFVLRVFAFENALLGLLSGGIAVVLAQVVSYSICGWLFEISYEVRLGESLLLVATTVLLVVGVGLMASLSILRTRPIVFLREQTQE